MSEFKPMVKMYTDEPGVSLKLKKGGKVKHHAKGGHESGHKPMEMHHMHGAHHAFESEAGSSPKKPSMMHRMKAMNPNLYAKGGKVAHKGMGGAMPNMTGVGEGMPTVNRAMSPAAIANMAPAKQAMRAAMVKKALLGMKKGGSADHKMIEKLEKELHHHESMKDSEHGGMAHKAHGGRMHHEHMAHGGKVHRISGHPEGSLEHHKHMAKHHAKMHKEGGSAHHKKMCEHHKAMCKGGHYASGGEIDSDMTRTTVKKSVSPYVHMMNDGEHMDHTSGKTGKVNLGNKGGYKHGGKAKHHYAAGGRATGSSIPSETNESETRGKNEMGGTIEGNEHYYENTDMHSARPFSGSRATGGVSMSNAGGFKHGGKAKMHHKADGGAIDKYDTRNTKEGGNWENRPANSTPKGKSHTTTGIVKLANAGGYKHGGKTSKKAYATGGNVNDMGKSVKMPMRVKHPPVANTLQSGTYKRGGNVHHFSERDGVGKGGSAKKHFATGGQLVQEPNMSDPKYQDPAYIAAGQANADRMNTMLENARNSGVAPDYSEFDVSPMLNAGGEDINSLYGSMLGRAPDPTGIAANRGASANTIRQSILASPEYRNNMAGIGQPQLVLKNKGGRVARKQYGGTMSVPARRRGGSMR